MRRDDRDRYEGSGARQSGVSSQENRKGFLRPLFHFPIFIFCLFALIAAAVILFRQPFSPAPEPGPAVMPAPIPENLAVGDVFTFGAYEQDNDGVNGPEPVEWQVLAVEDGRVLLISKYALDAKPYNTNWIRKTWESCSLRKWLNGDFYNSAFSPAEQERIVTVTNVNPDHPFTRIKGGRDTEDRVFLLTIDEANSRFPSDDARRCRATAYAKANGTYVNEYHGDSWYWLRSRGASSRTASLVLFSGYVNTVGYGVNNTGGYVRPAMWLYTNGK